MKTRLLLIGLFYRTFCSFSILISIGLWELARSPLGQAFWIFLPKYILLKIATDCLIWYYARRYNRDRLFFYANIGLSEKIIFLTSFLLDIFLFLLFILLTSLIPSIE